MPKNLQKLIRANPEINPYVFLDYEDPEDHIMVNLNDKDLIPIRINLPKAPAIETMENFGLPAKEQKWHPPKMPARLKRLEKQFSSIDEIWQHLEDNRDIFTEELKWMARMWRWRLNGLWIYINGKPTYMDGWNFFYCGFWNIDIGLPGYRDRDRRWFIAARFFKDETRKLLNLDEEEGIAIPDAKGNYQFEDTGHRLFYGFNYPKHRREGATYRAECINYEIISRTSNAWGGIQSMNEKQGKKAFKKHLISPWKKLPFFFKPNYEGSTDPKSELSFNPPAIRISSRGSIAATEVGLESMINFGPADKSEYDGDKLIFHHDDEVGKLKPPNDCWERHQVVKECLVTGANIVGFTIKTSTVGEMERGGGKKFEHQCKLSNFYQRTENGQTVSGLANLFFPADDGLEGFIGPFGESIINRPTKEQAAFINRKEGAREFLLNKRNGYIKVGDFESLSEQIRLYPMSFRECFRPSAKQSGFNLGILEARLDDLRFIKGGKVKGNFRWVDNMRDGEVEFIQSPNGKFIVSHQLNDNESNRKEWDEFAETWVPLNTHFGVAGADPFKFNKTEHNRKSNGAGAVIRKRTYSEGLNLKRKFICTYDNRTYDKNVYAEDMLMMCVYYGVQMFPEVNVPLIWDHFEDRGYKGFLLHKIDIHTFRAKETPGASTSEPIKQDLFSEFMTWIENEAIEETHGEILEQCRDIGGVEEMTDFDLFTAAGYALLGTLSIYDEIQKINNEGKDVDRFFKKRVYKTH
jgi:hypothetical protein